VRAQLQQPFFFLGRGRQTSVFASADGTCVLKLFRDAEKKRKKRRLKESLLGAALAQARIPKESGLLFCSLVGTKDKTLLVTLLTKKGKVETVDLSSAPFLLQRRATPLKEELLRLGSEGTIDQAKECVRSLFELLSSCRKKQVVDRDGSLIRNGNIGLVGTQAVLLDTGKLCVLTDSTKHTLHDLNRLKPLSSWCERALPKLLPTLKKCRKKYKETALVSNCVKKQ